MQAGFDTGFRPVPSAFSPI